MMKLSEFLTPSDRNEMIYQIIITLGLTVMSLLSLIFISRQINILRKYIRLASCLNREVKVEDKSIIVMNVLGLARILEETIIYQRMPSMIEEKRKIPINKIESYREIEIYSSCIIKIEYESNLKTYQNEKVYLIKKNIKHKRLLKILVLEDI